MLKSKELKEEVGIDELGLYLSRRVSLYDQPQKIAETCQLTEAEKELYDWCLKHYPTKVAQPTLQEIADNLYGKV